MDRRRTLVRLTPLAMERGRNGPSVPTSVVAGALGAEADLDEVVEALELLARRLTPTVLAIYGPRRRCDHRAAGGGG